MKTQSFYIVWITLDKYTGSSVSSSAIWHIESPRYTGNTKDDVAFRRIFFFFTHFLTHTSFTIPAYGKYCSSIKLSACYDLIELNVNQLSVQSREKWARRKKKKRFSPSKVHLNLVMVKIWGPLPRCWKIWNGWLPSWWSPLLLH